VLVDAEKKSVPHHHIFDDPATSGSHVKSLPKSTVFLRGCPYIDAMTLPRISLAIGVLALVLTGCSTSPEGINDEGFVTDMAVTSPSVEELGEKSLADGAAVSEQSAPNFEPSVITTGYLSLIVETPTESADAITALVEESGGRISSRSDYSPVDFGSPSSYLDIRVPYDVLDSTLAAIGELGVVQESSLNSVDVSLQKIDLDARLEVLDAAIERLQSLLNEAETTSDVVAVETALTERTAERDSLQSQRDYLSDQTLFATINVSLSTPADATPSEPDGFVEGLLQGLESIGAFFVGSLVWAGILLPWLGLLAIVVTVVVITRTVRRRRNTPE